MTQHIIATAIRLSDVLRKSKIEGRVKKKIELLILIFIIFIILTTTQYTSEVFPHRGGEEEAQKMQKIIFNPSR